jgi:uncharacterized membrane protein
MSSTTLDHPHPASVRRRLGWGAFWLGWGLGGFFDGILLHQILQWHHLLSGVAPDETAADLRFQVLADGVFHLVNYGLALLGLWLLWSARTGLDTPGSARRVGGLALIGFGIWHAVDAVLVHWILGLHRIRMDVANPLVWDLAWLLPFGLVTIAIGLWLLRADGGSGAPAGRTGATALSLAVLVSGGVALMPPAGVAHDRSLAVFRPGMDFPAIVAAAEAAGGRPVWSDAAGGVWLIAFEPGGGPAALYRHGALFVSNGPVAVGCLSWSEI